MSSRATTGDVALTAQPAAEEAFAPFGRLLLPGDRTYVGKRGRILLAIDEKRAGPRRVTDLYRYPEAKRVLLPLGSVAMWFVALEPGDKPGGKASAFLLPPGCGVVIREGVWHAGPMPMADAPLCEMLETSGASDRFDRRTLRELIDVAAVRILLPEDAASDAAGFDLSEPEAVALDAALEGRVRVAFVSFAGLDLGRGPASVESALAKAAEGLRAMWGRAAALGEIPGVQAARQVFRQGGIDQVRHPPRGERLLADALEGGAPPANDALAGALDLYMLRTRIPLAGYDLGAVAGPLRVAVGAAGEAYTDAAEGRRVPVEGMPVLRDATGVIGGPLGASQRVSAGAATRSALVTVFCPLAAERADIEEWLDGLVRVITEHCGGQEAHRLIPG